MYEMVFVWYLELDHAFNLHQWATMCQTLPKLANLLFNLKKTFAWNLKLSTTQKCLHLIFSMGGAPICYSHPLRKAAWNYPNQAPICRMFQISSVWNVILIMTVLSTVIIFQGKFLNAMRKVSTSTHLPSPNNTEGIKTKIIHVKPVNTKEQI